MDEGTDVWEFSGQSEAPESPDEKGWNCWNFEIVEIVKIPRNKCEVSCECFCKRGRGGSENFKGHSHATKSLKFWKTGNLKKNCTVQFFSRTVTRSRTVFLYTFMNVLTELILIWVTFLPSERQVTVPNGRYYLLLFEATMNMFIYGGILSISFYLKGKFIFYWNYSSKREFDPITLWLWI